MVVLLVLLLLGVLAILDSISVDRAASVLQEQRLEAEQALRDGEEQYRKLFDDSGDLIQSVNPDGRFAYVNPQWLNVLGYTEDEAFNLNFLEVVHPDERDHCRGMFEDLRRRGETLSIETASIVFDGRPSKSIRPATDVPGACVMFV